MIHKKIKGQTYPVTEVKAAFFDACAAVYDTTVKYFSLLSRVRTRSEVMSHALYESLGKDQTQGEQARRMARDMRTYPITYDGPNPGETWQDTAGFFREKATSATSLIILFQGPWGEADRARKNAERGQKRRKWTRVAHQADRVAEALERSAEAASRVVELCEAQAHND